MVTAPTPDDLARSLATIVRLLVQSPECVVVLPCDTGLMLCVAHEDLEIVRGKTGETLRALTWLYRAMCRDTQAKFALQTTTR